MKKIYLSFFSILILCLKSNLYSQKLNEITFEIIKEGDSAIEEKKQLIIDSDSDFNSLLIDIYANVFSSNNEQYIPKFDKIDFERYIVIGIFYGMYRDSGVGIYVDKILERSDKLIVRVIESYAGKNCATLPIKSHPFQLIKLKRTDKDIQFKIKKVIKDCN